ncbi:MAG: hypothetical protein KDN20_21215 [Verrucomicrobiae bacterium]|nr:hypothetical protein [Verrucomicrobiae bacterium]
MENLATILEPTDAFLMIGRIVFFYFVGPPFLIGILSAILIKRKMISGIAAVVLTAGFFIAWHSLRQIPSDPPQLFVHILFGAGFSLIGTKATAAFFRGYHSEDGNPAETQGTTSRGR